MEVMISAAVLVLVVLGVLAALDSVTRTAGANQARTIAATLAEQDQERLRSLPTGDLNKLGTLEDISRPVKVGEVTYTVASLAKWVVDSTGAEISCTLAAGEGSYLRITSTVTSPMTGAAVKPVVLSSIVAPRPGKGTLTAMVRNAAGQPVVGLGVQAVGPTPDTKTTNAAGCAVFDESDAGSYKLKLNATDWVDPDADPAPEKPATVSAGNLTTVEFVYDRKSSFTVSVVTKRALAPSEVADRSTGAMAGHNGLKAKFKRIEAPSGASAFTFDPMFPFAAPSPYLVYSGICEGNNPETYIPGYFTTRPSSVVQLTPAGAMVAATALEPAINLSVTWAGGVLSSNAYATVTAYPKTAGCGSTKFPLGNTDSTGSILSNPGLPFGTYDICVQYTDTTPSTDRTYAHTFPAVSNTNPAGSSLAHNFTTSSIRTTCA